MLLLATDELRARCLKKLPSNESKYFYNTISQRVENIMDQDQHKKH